MLVKCTQSVKFFSDMINNNDLTTHEQCCRVMIHKSYNKGDIVFREGSEGTTFFIILKGAVGVYIPERRPSLMKLPPPINEAGDSPKNKKNSLVSESSFKFKLIRTNTKMEEPNKTNPTPTSKSALLDKKNSMNSSKFLEFMNSFKDRSNDSEGNRVKVLVQGQAFGELALLDNKPRAATIICEEDCHFAVLEKQAFTEILSKVSNSP